MGARVVLADIDGETLNVTPDTLAAAITQKTRAIIPVHMAGQACEIDAIYSLAAKHKIPVVEDAVRLRQRPREEREREACVEDDLGRLRVDVEVVLGGRRDVPLSAAHHVQAADLRREGRVASHGSGEVRQRGLREYRQLARGLVDPTDELVDGVFGLGPLRRLREERVAHSVLAVDVLGPHPLRLQRLCTAGVDGDLSPAPLRRRHGMKESRPRHIVPAPR